MEAHESGLQRSFLVSSETEVVSRSRLVRRMSIYSQKKYEYIDQTTYRVVQS